MPAFFSGQFEFGGNIMPLWQAYTPAPHIADVHLRRRTGSLHLRTAGRRRHLSRRQPYAGDLALELPDPVAALSAVVSGRGRADLYHPQVSAECSEYTGSQRRSGIDGGTCVWNFAPQGGFGVHYFTRAKRSIDLGVNGVHISSASLGDRNPGVNASVQVQVAIPSGSDWIRRRVWHVGRRSMSER